MTLTIVFFSNQFIFGLKNVSKEQNMFITSSRAQGHDVKCLILSNQLSKTRDFQLTAKDE